MLNNGEINMSCIVMYQPYPTSSYLLPSGPPHAPPGPPSHAHHQLPSLATGFDRLPSTTSASAVATSPVNSPHSPATHQRLPPTNNGLQQQNAIIEPKLEKVCHMYLLTARSKFFQKGCNYEIPLTPAQLSKLIAGNNRKPENIF